MRCVRHTVIEIEVRLEDKTRKESTEKPRLSAEGDFLNVFTDYVDQYSKSFR